MNPTSLRYFRVQVDDSAGPVSCWPWRGRPTRQGYGLFGSRPAHGAHRVAYELAVGPIPDGHVVDHLCENPICVNPAHLQAVTQRVNVLRSPITMPNVNAAKTHCPQGHAYSSENTYIKVTPTGIGRNCRACKREAYARRAVA